LLGCLHNIALALGLDDTLSLKLTASPLSSVDLVGTMNWLPNGYSTRWHTIRRDGEAVQYVGVSSVKKVDGIYEVFDIQIEEDESFVASGVVLHNCYLTEWQDSLAGIVDGWTENVWL